MTGTRQPVAVICLAGMLLFLTVRSGMLLGWGDHFANIEDCRIAAGAETLRHALAAGWRGDARPFPGGLFFLYPPDHFSLGPFFAVLRHACLQSVLPLTPFTFRLELLLTQAATLFCWMLWAGGVAGRTAAAGTALAFTFLPPHLAEATFQASESHATAPFFVAVIALTTDRWLAAPDRPRAAHVALVGLACALAALHLPSLAVLVALPLVALLRPRARHLLPYLLAAALTALPVLWLLRAGWLPIYPAEGFLLKPSFHATGDKVFALTAVHFPRFCGGALLAAVAAVWLASALLRALGREPRQRRRLLLALVFPLCYLAGYLLSNAVIYEGSRLSHTYKYLVPFITPLLAFACTLLQARGLLPRLVPAAVLLLAIAGYRHWPAPGTAGTFTAVALRDNGYHQYGELRMLLADLPAALAPLPYIPDRVNRASYLRGVGTILGRRLHREAQPVLPALPAELLLELRAGISSTPSGPEAPADGSG